MIDLFPEGFEEVSLSGGVELAAYTDADGATRLWRAFGEFSSSDDVEDDWADRWRRFHRAVRVGRLWIGPPWEAPPADALDVVIDPGQAFGTGAHETTRLCLELLDEIERDSLLDVGCGSGVLAIAAAKLGFDPVEALDHDEAAVEATRRNAERNGVRVGVHLADALRDVLPTTGVAVANLSAAALERLAPLMRANILVASGYLVGQTPDLRGFRVVRCASEAGWAADLAVRER
jgi:ribosomal protein L11 methyltransferase